MIRSPLDVLLGAELPQILHEPPDATDFGLADDTLELADVYKLFGGFDPSPSQRIRVRNGMACRDDGLWAATRVGDFGGRQGAGKSDTIIARMFGGTLLAGETLTIYTAHEFPTANEIFLRIGSILEAWDDLSGLVEHERRAHGDQGFELRGPKGSEITGKRRWLFKTRTGKSGRGFAKADLLVYDEAQHLHAEHVAGSGPAKLANPNAQSWYAGSGGFASSTKAWEMRRQAIAGTGGRLSYTEHTAEVVSLNRDGAVSSVLPDPTDRDAWARANPGLGRWVSEEGMAALLDELGPDLFARECLCIWEPEISQDDSGPIRLADWDALIDATSTPEAETAKIAVATSPDQSWTTIGLAGKRRDGLEHVEIVEARPSTGWVVERLSAIVDRLGVRPLLPKGHALVGACERAGIVVDEVSPAELATSTGRLISATQGEAPLVRHRGEPALRKSIQLAKGSPSGKSGVVWSAPNLSTDISPLLAVTMAYGRLGTEDEKPAALGVVYA